MTHAQCGQTEWDLYDLIDVFGADAVQQLIQEDILYENWHKVRLSFTSDVKTLSKKIIETTDGEVIEFVELLQRVVRRYDKRCSPSRLKNILTVLLNFNQIQTVNLPVQTYTCLARDSVRFEPVIDRILSASDKLEPHCRFRKNIDDHAKEGIYV